VPTEANARQHQPQEERIPAPNSGPNGTPLRVFASLEDVLGKRIRKLLEAQRRVCRRLEDKLLELDRKNGQPENKNGRS